MNAAGSAQRPGVGTSKSLSSDQEEIAEAEELDEGRLATKVEEAVSADAVATSELEEAGVERLQEEPWEELEETSGRVQLEATISGEQLGHLLASSEFKQYTGKDLTISVDEAAAHTLYTVALGMAGMPWQAMPSLSPLYSDPKACQIYWQNWQNNDATKQMPTASSQKRRGQDAQDMQQNPSQTQPAWSQTYHQYQQHSQYQQYQQYQHPLYQQFLWNQQHQHQQTQPVPGTRGRKGGNAKKEVQHSKLESEEDGETKDGPSEKIGKPPRKDKPSQDSLGVKELSDIIVVSTRPGQPGDKAILECTPPDGEDGESQEDEAELPEDRRKTLVTGINLSNLSMPQMQDDDPYEDEEEEEQESDELVVEEDKPYISHKQAQSVRLLGSLEKIERRVCSAPGAPHLTLPRAPSQSGRPKTSPFPPTKRPESKDSKSGRAKSIRATAYYSRPTTVGGSDAETRPATVESRRTTPLSRTASPAKPDWDTSFYSMHQRRIPTYDALIDENCPVLSSPERLRQIIETRELPDAYLHIVRARFEQHRKFFDKEGRLGQRARPEHLVIPEPEEYPERLVERLVSGFEAEGVETEVKAPGFSLEALCREASKSRRGPRVSQHIVCCPEWQNSTLHEEILDGEDSSVRIDISDVEPTEQGTLAPSWKKLEGEIKLLWHRLQIPLDLRTAMDDGPMTSVTPESLYYLQAHLDNMQQYESATKKVIKNWLRREKLLESVCNSHALGVNDQRLIKLKADVQRLDRLSCTLVTDIGTWSRRFADLIVDPSRDPMAPPNHPKPRPIFVWSGRDAIERIQSDAERLVRGDLSACHLQDDSSSKAPQGSEDQSVSQRFKDWGFASSSQKSKAVLLPPCSLAAATVAAQNFKVTDVLFEGPAPSWYRPTVARAGIKALKRGLPCGGGDKRL